MRLTKSGSDITFFGRPNMRHDMPLTVKEAMEDFVDSLLNDMNIAH
jgi:hypothetical protein